MSLFDRLDNYFYSRKPTEVWLMVTLAAILVGYLLYSILEPISSNYRQEQESRNLDLRNKIDSANNYLRSITINGNRNYYINDLNKKIVKKQMALNELRQEMVKLDGSIKEFKNLLYTKDNWSKFMHNITVVAKKNNVKINSISNHYFDQNESFGKVLEVNVKAKGQYNKLLAFMNSMEQTDLVANISSVTLKASPQGPISDINLSVWGIKP